MLIRVLSYNIQTGRGMDGKRDLARQARVIAAQQPDLVALQEVDVQTRRVGGVDQVTELGRLTGLHAAFGKAMDYDGGQYGEAVLSRYPLLATYNHGLAADPGFEPRAALAVSVCPSGAFPEIMFIGTHLDHENDPANRNAQAYQLNKLFVTSRSQPIVMAGDFNAEPDSAVYRQLREHWVDAAADNPQLTFPAVKPLKRIDYIWFYPGDRFRVVETRVVEELMASDHRQVLAVLELLEK